MNMSIFSIAAWLVALVALLGMVTWIVIRKIRQRQSWITERRANERRSTERRGNDRIAEDGNEELNYERRNVNRRNAVERREESDWQEEYVRLREEVEFYSDDPEEVTEKN
jgi:flagellar biosynthesis/type III secretory pathway M-ring protein FliF/YscJ